MEKNENNSTLLMPLHSNRPFSTFLAKSKLPFMLTSYVHNFRFLNSTFHGVMLQNRKPGHVPSYTLQTLVEIQVRRTSFSCDL